MIYFVKAADDGDGHTDEKTVEILTAVPTSTPTPTPTPPGFEAVFANFFAPQKPLLKIQLSLVKLSFLKKGLC